MTPKLGLEGQCATVAIAPLKLRSYGAIQICLLLLLLSLLLMVSMIAVIDRMRCTYVDTVSASDLFS